MTYAARPAARPDLPWVAPGDTPVPLGGIDMTQSWLAGLTAGDLQVFDLARAEVSGVAPVAGLGDAPTLADVEGAPVWMWSPAGLANFRAHRVAEIKAEAGRRILAAYPLWKQSNLNKRASELNDIRFDRALTEAEDAERLALRAAAAWVDAVRAASNALEAALPSDAAGLAAFDAGVAAGWPADPAPQV